MATDQTVSGSVRLPPEVKQRLDELSRDTGLPRVRVLQVLLDNTTPRAVVDAQLGAGQGAQ